MDVRMPVTDSVAATRAVIDEGLAAQNGQSIGVIILTTCHIDEAVYAALRAGASGFLLKDAAPTEIIAAIRAVADGEEWLDSVVTRRLIHDFATQPEQYTPTPAQMAQLTSREREVLALLAQGMSNADVARKLFISETTVKTNLTHVMTKIGKFSRCTQMFVSGDMAPMTPHDPIRATCLTDERPGPLFADRAGPPDVVSHLRPATDTKEGDSGHLRRYWHACRPPRR